MRELTPGQVQPLLQCDNAVVFDLRNQNEVARTIEGAEFVDPDQVRGLVSAERYSDSLIILVCNKGNTSRRVATELAAHSSADVISVQGGLEAWNASGLPTVQTGMASSRYERQVALPEVGNQGQERLTDSSVLVVGLGGLGSPVGLYLAAAGVGTLGLADGDRVDITNLHRQISHDTDSVDTPKVDSAAKRLRALNPEITVATHNVRLTPTNAIDLADPYDIVVDASDNFETRSALNMACVRLHKPLVHGSVHKFEGRVTVFDPPQSPCYHCNTPTMPNSSLMPTCAEAGVLGSVTGITGSVQATEVIKLLLGTGRPLLGRMFVYDALDAESFEFALDPDPHCAVCAAGRM